MTPKDRKKVREVAAIIGRIGGKAKSSRKTEACRKNAKKPRRRNDIESARDAK